VCLSSKGGAVEAAEASSPSAEGEIPRSMVVLKSLRRGMELRFSVRGFGRALFYMRIGDEQKMLTTVDRKHKSPLRGIY